MVSKTKVLVGVVKCFNRACGHEVPVRQNDAGTLDVSCTWCGKPGYAKRGTEFYKAVMDEVEANGTKPAPEAVPEVVPGAVPIGAPPVGVVPNAAPAGARRAASWIPGGAA